MRAYIRFVVSAERTAEFVARAQATLAAFARLPAYQGGELTRSLDEPDHWCLATGWASVGGYRRALGDFEVRLNLTPMMVDALDEPSAYEVLAAAEAGGEVVVSGSDRAETR